jgi:hypothetical protein
MNSLPRPGIAREIPHFRDCAQFSQAEKSSEPLAFAKIALLSLLAHFCLVLAVVLLDPMPFSSGRIAGNSRRSGDRRPERASKTVGGAKRCARRGAIRKKRE